MGNRNAVKLLARQTRQLIDAKGSTIDQSVLLQDIIDSFGGPRQLAMAFVSEYHAAQPGGLARQKLLQTIQHLIISTTQFHLTKVKDETKLSDEELEKEIEEYLGKIHAGRLVSPAGAEEAAIRGAEAGPEATDGSGPLDLG